MDEDFKNLFQKMGIQTALYNGNKRRHSAEPVPTQKTVTGMSKKH
jgi:hypothetical protein